MSTNGSPRSDSICIYVFACVFVLDLNVQQANWYPRSQVRNVYRFPEHSNGTYVVSQQVALFFELDLGFGRVGWLSSAHYLQQLLNPILSSYYLEKKSLEDVTLSLVFTLSLVSCSVSPRRRNTKYRFLSGFCSSLLYL